MRDRLSGALKHATEAGDQRAAATLRLILTAIKERDHCAREAGAADGLSEAEIQAMLRRMVEQRREDITRCEECARVDVAEQEAEEIRIIERFLPQQMNEGQIASAVDAAIRDCGATRLKDTGRVIAALKERHCGQMDFGSAKRLLCERLH
ncbi:MAG TPA: GatB/YqeY domain-containing protein [Geminicoccaceae bacterium]|nr:GatB/YqeY domain-containing protein [Geminicoccaceae bacterium]